MSWKQKYVAITKPRRFFGRQPLFSNHNKLMVDIPSNHLLIKEYLLRNPVDRSTQESKQFAYNIINTEGVPSQNRSMNHVEGGWPKDINYLDEEAVSRYRKKVEREESWQDHVVSMEKPAVDAIFQNNAVNIYEDYFETMDTVAFSASHTAYCVNDYRDPEDLTREVLNVRWFPLPDSKNFIAVYGFPYLHPPKNYSTNNYIWDINDPIQPASTLASSSFATHIDWNPKDPSILAGALFNGAVCTWDSRVGSKPTQLTSFEKSHRDVACALTWVLSKTHSEFYSGSIDGTVFFWDTRNFSKPYHNFILDPSKSEEQDVQKAHGCSVLEFEYTIPVRFMAGTDKGSIFLGNRKGVLASEIIAGHFKVLSGPVKSLERNPSYLKNILVVGDWCTKIWTEDTKNAPLTRTINHRMQLNCGTWSRNRCSLYFTGRDDGRVDFWDLLMNQRKPIYTMDIFKSPITALRGSNNGKLLAVGTRKGVISMVKLDKSLTVSGPQDKPVLSSNLEREIRRVKILEGRIREIVLKLQQTDGVPYKQLDLVDSNITEKEPEKLKESEKPKETAEDTHSIKSSKTIKSGKSIATNKSARDDVGEFNFDYADGGEMGEEIEFENEDENRMYDIDHTLPFLARDFNRLIENIQEKRRSQTKIFEKTPFELEIEAQMEEVEEEETFEQP